MRVIVDTDVFVSGLINPNGAPGAIVDAVLDGRVPERLGRDACRVGSALAENVPDGANAPSGMAATGFIPWIGRGCVNRLAIVALGNDVGHVLCPTYGLPAGPPEALAISPDGRRACVSTPDTLVWVDLERLETLGYGHNPDGSQFLDAPPGRVVFSPDGGRLYVKGFVRWQTASPPSGSIRGLDLLAG